MATVWRLVLLAVLCLFLIHPAASAGNRTVVFTHSDSLPPYSYLENGVPKGLLVDFWTVWAGKAGVTPVFLLAPYDQSVAMVENGTADVHMGMAHLGGHAQALEVGPDFMTTQVVLMVREERDAQGVLDLKDMEVGVVRGEKAEHVLRETYPFIRLKVFDNDDDLFAQAASGKLHAFAKEPFATLYAMSRTGGGDDFEQLAPLFTQEHRPATAKGAGELMRELERGLARISEMERRAIFSRWIEEHPLLPEWFWPLVFSLLGLFLLLVLAGMVLLLRARVRLKNAELRQALDRLKRQEEKYHNFFNNAVGGVFLSTPDGRLLEANPSFQRILGASDDQELKARLAKGVQALYAEPEQRGVLLERLEKEGAVADFETVFRRLDGRTIWVRLSANAVPNDSGGIDYIEGVLQDITSQKLSEQHLEMRASQDALTGLPNRYLFQDRFEHALANARRYGRVLALLFVDLDDFKIINDRSGHQVGDMVLREVGSRLRRRTRESDTVARLGGDEFAIILESVTKPEDAAEVAASLVDWLSKPYEMEGVKHVIGASVGICIFPDDGDESTDLLNKADRAMYKAKESDKGFCYFSEC